MNVESPPPSLVLRRMPSLDSLRGLEILMVVLFHGFGAYAWQANFGPFRGHLFSAVVDVGRYGVNGFFVLSGFLITGILLRDEQGPGSMRRFYVRRMLRILPAYALLLVILRLLHVIDSRFALAAILFAANFARLFGAPLTEYLPLWSIAVEERFYLVWPACVRRFRRRSLAVALMLVIAGEPLLRLGCAHISSRIDIRYKTPFVLDFLAYGALLALLVHTARIHGGNVRRIGAGLLASGTLLGAVAVWAAAFHGGITVTVLEDLPFTWAACGLLLLGVGRDYQRWMRDRALPQERGLSLGVLPFFGYISYGLYLVHMLVYMLAQAYVTSHAARARVGHLGFFSAVVGGCIAASTLLAFLSRRFFEERFLRWKDRLAPVTVPAAGFSAAAESPANN